MEILQLEYGDDSGCLWELWCWANVFCSLKRSTSCPQRWVSLHRFALIVCKTSCLYRHSLFQSTFFFSFLQICFDICLLTCCLCLCMSLCGGGIGDVHIPYIVDQANRTKWITEQVSLAKKQFMDGINIDVEQAVEDGSPEYYALTALVNESTETFHREIPGSQVEQQWFTNVWWTISISISMEHGQLTPTISFFPWFLGFIWCRLVTKMYRQALLWLRHHRQILWPGVCDVLRWAEPDHWRLHCNGKCPIQPNSKRSLCPDAHLGLRTNHLVNVNQWK